MSNLSATILKVSNELATDLLNAFHNALEQYDLGSNTNIYKDSQVSVNTSNDSVVVKLMVPYYIQYIESGRPPKATKVPVEALIDWASRRGIPTDNNTIYAIRESIYLNGIAPRPVWSTTLAAFEPLLADYKAQLVQELIPVVRATLLS